MQLGKFCVCLRRETAAGDVAAGIFHRLTGKSYELSPSADALLLEIAGGGIALDDVEDAAAHTFLEQLHSEGFITVRDPEHLTSCGVPVALADFLLHIPVRNPAIALACPDGTGVLYRNADLDTCHLPRTEWKPAVLRDAMSQTATAILRVARRGVSWRQAEAELLACGLSAADIHECLQFLTDPRRQMLRWVSPRALVSDARAFFQFPCQSFVHGIESDAAVTPAGTHYHDIADGSVNFDWLETTVSHAFRMPTRSLHGESFGARLAGHYLPWLRKRALEGPLRILEIGAGMGDLARAFASRLVAECTPRGAISYTILDASPALLRQQSSLGLDGVDFHFVMGDAQRGLPEGCFDFILCNEVIADMENIPQPDGRLEQCGALQLITSVARHLAPGGKAYVSEYGDLDTPPERAGHLDHAEYSVQFRPLLARAEELGLQAVVLEMSALLRPVRDASVLIGQQERYLCLAAALGGRGAALQSRVYDEGSFTAEFGATFEEGECLSPLFARQHAEIHFGPQISQFKVLEVTARSIA